MARRAWRRHSGRDGGRRGGGRSRRQCLIGDAHCVQSADNALVEKMRTDAHNQFLARHHLYHGALAESVIAAADVQTAIAGVRVVIVAARTTAVVEITCAKRTARLGVSMNRQLGVAGHRAGVDDRDAGAIRLVRVPHVTLNVAKAALTLIARGGERIVDRRRVVGEERGRVSANIIVWRRHTRKRHIAYQSVETADTNVHQIVGSDADRGTATRKCVVLALLHRQHAAVARQARWTRASRVARRSDDRRIRERGDGRARIDPQIAGTPRTIRHEERCTRHTTGTSSNTSC